MQNTLPLASDARPDRTQSITRGVLRLFRDLAEATLTEFKLVNGRRADVAALDKRGRLTIVEVKSCQLDFTVDDKWPDYLEFCDRFYFATDPDFPRALLPEGQGHILADAFGAAIDRPAADITLTAARRKAVMLRFARQAAFRAFGHDGE